MRTERVCTQCRQSKNFSEFHKSRTGSEGLASRCKTCVKAYQQALRETKPKKDPKRGPKVDLNRRVLEDGTEVKKCTRCGVEKDPGDFYTRSGTTSLYAHCKSCHTQINTDRDRRKGRSNPEERRRQQRDKWARNSFVYAMRAKASKYKISVEEATRLSTSPCEMCGTNDPGVEGATMFIDHNHTTGQVRGGLCRSCNFYVGWRENHENLEKAYEAYAQKYGKRYS